MDAYMAAHPRDMQYCQYGPTATSPMCWVADSYGGGDMGYYFWQTTGFYAYLDSNCNVVSPVGRPVCGTGTRYDVSYWTPPPSEPISLIWEPENAAKRTTAIVSFPLNLQHGKYYYWKASAAMPLIVYDPQHTGNITSATQLFGNWTFGGKSRTAMLGADQAAEQWRDGYEALAELDLNRDGRISGKELEPLGLWFDNNTDGVSQPGEVKTVEEAGVTALFYTPDHTNPIDGEITASAGYEKVVDGKTIKGASVDWFTKEYANAGEALIERTTPAFASLEPLQPMPFGSAGTVQGAAKDAAPADGAWIWQLNSEDTSKFGGQQYGGVVWMRQEGDKLFGVSMVQMAADDPRGEVKSVIAAYPLGGTIARDEKGGFELRFVVTGGATTTSNVVHMDKDGKALAGTSEQTASMGGRADTITYSWKATKASAR